MRQVASALVPGFRQSRSGRAASQITGEWAGSEGESASRRASHLHEEAVYRQLDRSCQTFEWLVIRPECFIVGSQMARETARESSVGVDRRVGSYGPAQPPQHSVAHIRWYYVLTHLLGLAVAYHQDRFILQVKESLDELRSGTS